MPLSIFILTVSLALCLICASIVDLEQQVLPDFLTVIVSALGVVALSIAAPSVLIWHGLAAVLTYQLFFVVGEVTWRLSGAEGFGLGDTKLLAAGTLWVGGFGLPSVLLIASLTGLLFALVPRVIGRQSEIKRRIAFGPFIGFGIFSVWVVGPIQI